jgi:hypothetical protein
MSSRKCSKLMETGNGRARTAPRVQAGRAGSLLQLAGSSYLPRAPFSRRSCATGTAPQRVPERDKRDSKRFPPPHRPEMLQSAHPASPGSENSRWLRGDARQVGLALAVRARSKSITHNPRPKLRMACSIIRVHRAVRGNGIVFIFLLGIQDSFRGMTCVPSGVIHIQSVTRRY